MTVEPIILVGLPGAGRKRFAEIYRNQSTHWRHYPLYLDCPIAFEEDKVTRYHFWCLIDVRSPLSDPALEQILSGWVEHAHGVILNFVDQSELSAQLHWQQWLKPWLKDKAVLRLFHQQLPKDWEPGTFGTSVALTNTVCQNTEFVRAGASLASMNILTIPITRVNLEHLLMVLDAARHHSHMQVLQVQGRVLSTEYVHPVTIELTPNRLDTFPCENANQEIRIMGQHLDDIWWQEMISACQA